MEKYLNEITPLSEKQIKQFEMYYHTLLIESEKYNLTNLKTKEDIYIKHFLDSIIMLKYVDFNQIKTLADVGTGAGFPGIPLKIIRPDLQVTLIEPTTKRCNFLKLIIEQLQLEGIKVVNDRVENLTTLSENFDLVTARAVAPMNILVELITPLAKINGKIVLLKGNVDEELEEAKNAINKLKIKLDNKYVFELPNNLGSRTILTFNKMMKTPEIYPRPYAKIKKQPL